MMFSVTPIFVLLLIFLNIVFLLPIGPHRIKVDVPFWGGEEKLDRLVRGHGNFIEIAPLFLIALATAEYLGVSQLTLWLIGAVMLASRVIHYVGMIKPVNPMNRARLVGTLMSLGAMSVLGLCIGWKLLTRTTV